MAGEAADDLEVYLLTVTLRSSCCRNRIFSRRILLLLTFPASSLLLADECPHCEVLLSLLARTSSRFYL